MKDAIKASNPNERTRILLDIIAPESETLFSSFSNRGHLIHQRRADRSSDQLTCSVKRLNRHAQFDADLGRKAGVVAVVLRLCHVERVTLDVAHLADLDRKRRVRRRAHDDRHEPTGRLSAWI